MHLPQPAPHSHPSLTPRECEVAGYVLNGSANKVIALDLGISLRTVEAHRARIFQKLGVRHAVAFAHLFYRLQEPGLIDSYLVAQANLAGTPTQVGQRSIDQTQIDQPSIDQEQLGTGLPDNSSIGSMSG